MASAMLSDKELSERVAILKRFRELLVLQRGKFSTYLEVLEHEKTDIQSDDVDKLLKHVELEEAIVSEIFTFQKVIDPLEDMYRAVWRKDDETDVPELKATLEHLKEEVAKKSGENRGLLKQHMAMLRNEVLSLRNPTRKSNKVYSSSEAPGLIDIKG